VVTILAVTLHVEHYLVKMLVVHSLVKMLVVHSLVTILVENSLVKVLDEHSLVKLLPLGLVLEEQGYELHNIAKMDELLIITLLHIFILNIKKKILYAAIKFLQYHVFLPFFFSIKL
jgi:hypothetical protein